MKRAGIVFLGWVLLIPSASLADSWVTFDLRSPQAGTVIDTAGSQAAPVFWSLAVEVTDDNQGLASYLLDVTLTRQGDLGPYPVQLPRPEFSQSFNVSLAGGDTEATVATSYLYGGPFMHARSVGDHQSQPGVILGLGSSYESPWTYSPKGLRMTPGVGRAERANDMLVRPYDGFVLNDGYIPTGALTPGTYVVSVRPYSIQVLDPTLDLATNLAPDVVFMVPVAGENVSGDSFTFTIVPEPGVLLLVAAGAALRRHRRTA